MIVKINRTSTRPCKLIDLTKSFCEGFPKEETPTECRLEMGIKCPSQTVKLVRVYEETVERRKSRAAFTVRVQLEFH